MAFDIATREAEALLTRLGPSWSTEALQQVYDAHVRAGDGTVACALLRQHALTEHPDAQQVASALSGAPTLLFDALWAVDQELDARRDVGAARGAADGDVALDGAPVLLDTARARLANVLACLIENNTVDREEACIRLDSPLLGALGLIDTGIFTRRGIQIRTATFFKQQKYNLLREENEGYSALVTELVAQMGPPLRVELGRVVEQVDAEVRDAQAEQLADRMLVLTGMFSLDANRVLDLLLDVFATHVVSHHTFFRALLRAGKWEGSLVAHLLGFKFEYYAQPNALDTTPEELYLATALLIRDGFVAPADIYPYLTPGVDFCSLRSEYYDELSKRNASGSTNALAMAAPLGDDGDTPSGSAAETPSAKIPPQLPELLRVLLGIGAVDHVRPFLERSPWLFGAFPGLAAAYIRLVEYQLEPALRGAATVLHTQLQLPNEELTMYIPLPCSTATTSFVFCVGDWADGLVQHDASTCAELIPQLALLGVHIHKDVRFFQRVCRLVVSNFSDERWHSVLRAQLLPAVSLTSANAAVLHDMWLILKQLPYTARFALYGEWEHRAYTRPELRFRRAETEREARGILRRVSTDNLRASGRSLAKAAHANPTVFFRVVLNQVQSYDNLIEPVVDSAKYLTALEHDVFTFCLLEALSNPDKERTKSDGTNASLWLKSLASFAGALYKKYPAMDCMPVLQYLVNRLRASTLEDLVVLSELVLKLAGIEPLSELSDAQIAALSGGLLLRTEASMPLVAASSPTGVLLARSAFKKGAQRLWSTLHSSGLALPLLILLAQQRQACVFGAPDEEAHIKALGSTFDTCAHILFQYLEFLVQTLEPAELSALLPPPDMLISRFGIDTPVAFAITRAALQYEIKNANETHEVWPAALVPVMERMSHVLPEAVRKTLGESFFVTFWQLGLADILVPMDRYQQEINRMRQSIRDVDAATDLSEGIKKSTRMRLNDSIASLSAELKDQTLAHQTTRRRLQAEKGAWFAPNVDRALLAQQIVEECLHPRALLSPTDALFSARFLRLLHTNGTLNLPTLAVYDALFLQHIAQTIFSATEDEARNYSRFVNGLLADTGAWLASEETFKRDAIGDNLPGFALSWEPTRGSRKRTVDAPLAWESYRTTVLLWHQALHDAFAACLKSTEYMRIRNALVVMNRVSQHFPLLVEHGKSLQQAVAWLETHEAREDICVLAHGLAANLKKRASGWVGPSYFGLPEPEPEPEPEPGPEPKPEPEPEAMHESKPEPMSEPKSQPKQDPEPKSEPEPKSRPEPELAPEQEPPKAEITPTNNADVPAERSRPQAPKPAPKEHQEHSNAKPSPHSETPRQQKRDPPSTSQSRRSRRRERERSPQGDTPQSLRIRGSERDERDRERPAREDPRDMRGPRDAREPRDRRDGRDPRSESRDSRRDGRDSYSRLPRGRDSRHERDLGWEGRRDRGWGSFRDDPRGRHDSSDVRERDPPRFESNAVWNREPRRDDARRRSEDSHGTADDDQHGRKRSLADRLGHGETHDVENSDTPDSKRAKMGQQLRIHQSARDHPPDAESDGRRGGGGWGPRRWGREWGERQGERERERERRKRRAGGD